MHREAHWETLHREKAADAVSWYRPHLDVSLELIEEFGEERSSSIIDVGAGQSTLVDDLLTLGYERLTVLDLSAAAIEAVQRRLGDRGGRIRWLVGDVTAVDLEPASYDVWHDRAVFHFLTETADRGAYVRRVRRALRPGGHAVLGTFALDGPPKCSGLDVVRYDAAALQAEFGAAFQLVKAVDEEHRTPFGTAQPFQYGCFRMG
ncbi:MAG: class I SAM-dependent methyltransferase [Acidobacteriota bacterium]